MVAVWAIGGFYLALGPSLASLLGGTTHVAGGAVIACQLLRRPAGGDHPGRHRLRPGVHFDPATGDRQCARGLLPTTYIYGSIMIVVAVLTAYLAARPDRI